jgi:hypothetical protein
MTKIQISKRYGLDPIDTLGNQTMKTNESRAQKLAKFPLKPTGPKIAMKFEIRISKSETNSNVQNQQDGFH